MKFTEQQFIDFLKKIDLNSYRSKYAGVKIVEMDLPKNIQALKTIYEQYWKNTANLATPMNFDDYYDNVYYQIHEQDIKEFWFKKSGFGTTCDCFKRGLRARIYRTWASLITQIHGGYVAESVFGNNSVQMSEELDHAGVDFRITLKNGLTLDVQIKKETGRKEIARMDDKSSKNINIKYIRYKVPTEIDYNNPYYKIKKKHGELRDSLRDFVKFNKNGTLNRLDNGFVVFTKQAFENLLK